MEAGHPERLSRCKAYQFAVTLCLAERGEADEKVNLEVSGFSCKLKRDQLIYLPSFVMWAGL